jgi:drug/metabolite transporter (DMT)-like permease
MDWINVAILTAAIMGLLNIIDSHLLLRRMPGLRAYLLPIGIMFFIYTLPAFALFPLPEGVGNLPVLAAIISGLLRATCIIIMLDSLKREDVSQVAPIVYTYPIFVALIAMPLLGESLGLLEWLALIIVVSGAVMVSIKKSPSGSTILQPKLLLLLGSSFLYALADIAGKYALAFISFWNMFWVSSFTMAGAYIAFSISPQILRQLIHLENKGRTLALLVVNETMAPLAVVMAAWALQQGPVSLVSTILSSRIMFVAIYSVILSRIWPSFLDSHLSKKMLALRLTATAMIVVGIAIIQLVA